MLTERGRPALAGIVLMALAGCSGGGGGGGPSEAPDGPFPDGYQDRINLSNEYVERMIALDYTTPSTLPTSGTATYVGPMYIADVDRALIGRAELGVDFEANNMQGEATDFRDASEALYPGTLTLEMGNAIQRDVDPTQDYTFFLSLDGTLIYPDRGPQDLEGMMRGDFYRSDGEYLYANSEGLTALACDRVSFACREVWADVALRDTDQ